MGGLRVEGLIPLGSRNSELTRIAGMLVGRGAAEALVVSVLAQVNLDLCDPPMDQDELYQLAQSVAKYGADTRQEPYNDQGNARRLVSLHGNRMRWLSTRNVWLVWNGKRWAPNEEEAMRLAKTVPDMLLAAADSDDNKDRAKAIRGWARSSGSRGHLEAMLKLAATEPNMSVTEDQLDKHWWLLNTPDCVVDLRNGKRMKHSPDMMMTRITSVSMKAGPAATWKKFLDRVLEGDADLAKFLAAASGYSMTGTTREQVLFLMWGEGQNGKTTFLEAIRNIMGDYSLNTPFDTFTSTGGGPRNDIARLAGVRFTLATEGDEGSRLNESLVKRLTGGDVITSRYLYAEYFDYVPRFKIWLATNYRPRIRGSDFAIWRRIRLVPFIAKISEAEKDPALPGKLRAEYPEILYWLVQGARMWYKQGLPTCDKVTAATMAYRQDQDTLGQFIEECCTAGDTECVQANDMYQSFYRWALQQGEHPWTNKVFKLRLEERGYHRARRATGYYWLGLGLREDAPDGRDLKVVGGRGR